MRPCRLEHLRLSTAGRQAELTHSPLDKPQIRTLRIIKRWVLKQCLGVGVEPYAELSKGPAAYPGDFMFAEHRYAGPWD